MIVNPNGQAPKKPETPAEPVVSKKKAKKDAE